MYFPRLEPIRLIHKKVLLSNMSNITGYKIWSESQITLDSNKLTFQSKKVCKTFTLSIPSWKRPKKLAVCLFGSVNSSYSPDSKMSLPIQRVPALDSRLASTIRLGIFVKKSCAFRPKFCTPNGSHRANESCIYAAWSSSYMI